MNAFRLIQNDDATYTIAGPSGDLVRTTHEGRVFVTANREFADEALAFLNQPHPGLGRREGSHRIKSMFGPL
jgi:hypothetical protein